jgi:hypothetical protein
MQEAQRQIEYCEKEIKYMLIFYTISFGQDINKAAPVKNIPAKTIIVIFLL